MKKVFLAFLFLIKIPTISAQKSEAQDFDHISNYFQEIKTATQQNTRLWNKDLYGGILLVEPKTRQLYSNEEDAKNSLTKQGNIYVGQLPDNINMANTSLMWNGKNWAMIMLPLSENKNDRINLLAHELFHKAQSALGFTQSNKESNHLDQKDGRIYLRLELEALTKAVLSDSKKEQKEHLTNALIFRKYRHTLFPESSTTENQLELNEGLAEYTGFMISGRNKVQTKEHFVKTTNAFLKNPTYVRSFAYSTIPVYGYLLSQKDKYWNQKIKGNTNLTDFFIQDFGIKIPAHLKASVDKIANNYNGATIFSEEEIRDEKIKKLIAEYKSKLIEQPHLEIKFEKMNVSFDPRNIIPIEDKGTVYPTIRVTDNWGILEVTKGALMSPNWDKISVSSPVKINDELIEGEGWTIKINKAYTVKKDEKSNNYNLTKK